MGNLLTHYFGLPMSLQLAGLFDGSGFGHFLLLLLAFLGMAIVSLTCMYIISWYFSWVFIVDDIFRWLGEPGLRINKHAVFLLGIPILNFFFAYIFVLNLTVSIKGWSHENGGAIDNAVHKTGLRSCHAGIIFMGLLILANLWQGIFIYLAGASFLIWLLYLRKYRNALRDVYQIMDAHDPSREDEAEEED